MLERVMVIKMMDCHFGCQILILIQRDLHRLGKLTLDTGEINHIPIS